MIILVVVRALEFAKDRRHGLSHHVRQYVQSSTMATTNEERNKTGGMKWDKDERRLHSRHANDKTMSSKL